MSENSIEFSLSNSEQRDSWLNSGHRTLDADKKQQGDQMKRTCTRTRWLKTAVSVYGPSKRLRPDRCAREGRRGRIRVFGSSQLMPGRSTVPSLRPCQNWEFRGFLCLTFFVVFSLCNHNKILQGTGGESSIIPPSSSLSVALEL